MSYKMPAAIQPVSVAADFSHVSETGPVKTLRGDVTYCPLSLLRFLEETQRMLLLLQN